MNHQIAIISLLSLPCLALEPIIGHIDIDPSYNTTTQLSSNPQLGLMMARANAYGCGV